MKEITIPCDRCGKLINGCISIDGTITSGYYDVSDGPWNQFALWDEYNICDTCMWADKKYQAMYSIPKK
jgi:hypothetical protein